MDAKQVLTAGSRFRVKEESLGAEIETESAGTLPENETGIDAIGNVAGLNTTFPKDWAFAESVARLVAWVPDQEVLRLI